MPDRQAGQVSSPSYDSSGTDTSDVPQQQDVDSTCSELPSDIELSWLIKRMHDAQQSVLAGKLGVLPELLGTLFTADLQVRLTECTSLEQMYPEVQQDHAATCTPVGAAAEGFALVARRPGERNMSAACAMDVRMLAAVIDHPLTDEEWVSAALLTEEEPLRTHITRLLTHAATLQHSPELASADRLAPDAVLPRVIQSCPAAALLSSMTAGDILAMRRSELPALWASLAAADVCMALIWRAATGTGWNDQRHPLAGMVGLMMGHGITKEPAPGTHQHIDSMDIAAGTGGISGRDETTCCFLYQRLASHDLHLGMCSAAVCQDAHDLPGAFHSTVHAEGGRFDPSLGCKSQSWWHSREGLK
jgi:hypothetical protein